MNWVYKKKDGNKVILGPNINHETKMEIFEKLWKIDDDDKFIKMQDDEAILLIELFKFTNSFRGLLKKTATTIKIENIDLVGYEKIEKAFNFCEENSLAEMLTNFIAEIYTSPGKKIEQTKEEMINILLDRIIANLKRSFGKKDYWSIKKQIMLTSKVILREEEIYPVGHIIPRFFAFKDYNIVCKARE